MLSKSTSRGKLRKVSLPFIFLIVASVVPIAFNTLVAPIGEASAQAGGQGQQPPHISFKYTQFLDQSGCLGQWCGTNIFTGSFTSAANLHPFEDGYAGNGTGLYEQTEDRDTDPVPPACPQRGSYHHLTSGPAVMEVIASPSGLNYTVQVTWTGAYRSTWEKNECGQYESGATEYESGIHIMTCDFYEVDLEKGGTYEIVGPIEGSVCSMTIGSLGSENIEVTVDKPIISPLDRNPSAKVTVTASRADGTRIKGMDVKIEVCTLIGKEDTDGHMHDSRGDPCAIQGRPSATLTYNGRPFIRYMAATTDSNGQILLDYEPPWSPRMTKDKITHIISYDFSRKLFISGEDKIIATKIDNPSVKDEASITTKVSGLQVMPGSPGCSGTANYYFIRQGQHECLFYGTPATNTAVARIAKAFVDKQDECKSKPGGICTMTDASGKNVTFTITGANKKVRITAMSLPWGGTHDIKGDWYNPHVTHNDGKAIDIGLSELGASEKHRRLLLWHIISLDSNFRNFEVKEGNPFSYTVDHFHANFSS